jgi:hypothetical protein
MILSRTIGVLVADNDPPSNGGSVDYLSRYWSFSDDQVGNIYAYKYIFYVC